MFPMAYFRQIYRLHGWPESEAEVYFKKREVAIFTKEVIYGRFDRGVLLSLHVLNPYTGYMTRHYKHFQFLTEQGSIKLAIVIRQAIDLMKESSTYYEFRKKWFEKYGVPYQLALFSLKRPK